jgi:hypothetical protein
MSLKPGCYFSEGTIYDGFEINRIEIYVAIETKYNKLILSCI